jgi:hypothetical protein
VATCTFLLFSEVLRMSSLVSGRASLIGSKAWIGLALLSSVINVGCGGDSTAPAYGPPTTYTKQAGDGGTGVVATVATPTPVLHVADAEGRAVPNVEVVFSVASGGGSVTGGTVVTNAEGNATVGSWTLGTTAGANTLNATSNGQVRAIFSRTATAGAAATITKVVGDLQTSSQGNLVLIRPSVRVRDAHGNNVQGAAVTFAVASGGGTMTGETQATDASGVATIGSWRMGTSGTNTLTASVAGAPTVTFSATATVRCTPVGTLTLGAPISGALASTDCTYLNGLVADWYTFTTATQQGVEFGVSSAAFDAFFELFDSERAVAGGDDTSPTNFNALVRAIVPPGTYQAAATSAEVTSQTGAYTISATAAPESGTGCIQTFVFPGVTTSQSIATTDCADISGSNTWYTDLFGMRMVAGRTYTVTMTTTAAFNPFLVLLSNAGQLLVGDDRSTGTTAQVVYTPATTTITFLAPSTEIPFATFGYTLTVAVSGGAARPTAPTMARPRFDGSTLLQLLSPPKLGRFR